MAGNVITTCMPPPTATTTTVSEAQAPPPHAAQPRGAPVAAPDATDQKGALPSDTPGKVPLDGRDDSRMPQGRSCSTNPFESNVVSKAPQPATPGQDGSQRPMPPPRLASLGQREGSEVPHRRNTATEQHKSFDSRGDAARRSATDDKTAPRDVVRNFFETGSRDPKSSLTIEHKSFDPRIEVTRRNAAEDKATSRDIVRNVFESSSRDPKSAKDKGDSLTESSEGSESIAVAKHRSHKRERRPLKGSEQLQKPPHQVDPRGGKSVDDSKSELQRSESDGNQNSAPECDLSLSGSPFKEGESPKTLEKKDQESKLKDDSERKGSPVELQRNSPPVRDDNSNAQKRFSFSKDPEISFGNSANEHHHRLKAKTKSDPLDQRRDRIAQEPSSVLSSPSSVMRHKSHGVVAHAWEGNRFLDRSNSWFSKPKEDTTTPCSSVSGRSLHGGSSSNTSSSQDGLPPEFCDHPPRDEGRFVVFDSKDHLGRSGRPWRSTLSDSYRERQQNDSELWKASHDDKKNAGNSSLKDESRQVPEKDESGTFPPSQADSNFRKMTDYSSYSSRDPADLQSELESLRIRNSALLRDLEEVMESRDEKAKENASLSAHMQQLGQELDHAREALAALKQDRKRLKAEKFDLLTQMKQLYSTLEDKEEELREFIRNYERKMKENEESIKQLSKEREALEQEKWSILKRARDEAERAVLLCTQIGLKDQHIKELQDELSVQIHEKREASNLDLRQSNGYGSPGSRSYRATTNGVETPTPTPGSEATTSPSFTGTPTRYADPTAASQQGPDSSPDHRPSLLSRSAEDIFNSSVLSGLGGAKKKAKEKKGTWGSISRVFSRSKRRKALDPQLFENNRASWSPKECSSPMNEECYLQKLRLLEETHGTPMQHWRAATVLAWLEITMDMPQYGTLCAENIKSGKVLLELSESELEEGLGITNVMHRRKLRLAIEEHRQPSLCRYPKICLMTHSWVVEEWLPSIALTCYLPSFSEHLVDGRVLDTLSKKDLEKHFGITRKFHQLGIMHAIQLLRILNFDRQVLAQRRLNSENMDVDPLVWTNQRIIKWAISIDLGEYADNLRNTGVHGALAVLEPTFTADTIATALGIPTSKNIIRRHLTTEWQNLIQPARLSLESESLVAKKSKSEKRLSSGSSSVSLVSQGRSSSSIMPSYARRTLDRYDRRRSSWRFSTWKSSQESLKSTSSKKAPPVPPTTQAERPHLLPLSPKLNSSRHRRTFSSHSDVETLTVTPV